MVLQKYRLTLVSLTIVGESYYYVIVIGQLSSAMIKTTGVKDDVS
jgi:hypothetical protein